MGPTIALLAEVAAQKGCQVLSFDLPEHGDRKDEPRQCNPPNAIQDLSKIMKYARTITNNISLFGCSIGAYFSMLAYRDEAIRQALFLSPVVDMKQVIENMMRRFDISEERLRQEKKIATPAKTLYWDYYQYVCAHPVSWDKPTAILYGAQDTLCEAGYMRDFAERTNANLTILEDGEHWFHTEKHLAFYRDWLEGKIIK